MPHDLSTESVLELLREVAAAVITPRFRALRAEEVLEKSPGDLVTAADREAETRLTEALTTAYPAAVVLGEEAVAADPDLLRRYADAEHAFTVDPLDGTQNFVHGSPDHAVMVGELRDGTPTRAWVWQPAHAVAWVAERDRGTRRDGRLVRRGPSAGPVHGVATVHSLVGARPGGIAPLALSWVCSGVDYPRLLEGATDLVVNGRSLPWDHVPGALLVAEAGGVVRHPDGSPWQPTAPRPGLVVAADDRAYALVADDLAALAARGWPEA